MTELTLLIQAAALCSTPIAIAFIVLRRTRR
jgi:hypothetical protein